MKTKDSTKDRHSATSPTDTPKKEGMCSWRDYEDVERHDEEKEAAVNANKLMGGTKNEKLKDTLDDKVE
jgi:hypothetical protein